MSTDIKPEQRPELLKTKLTDDTTAVILHDMALGLRDLVERAIIAEHNNVQTCKDLRDILSKIDALSLSVAPVIAEHHSKEAVSKARSLIHAEESARREAFAAYISQVLAPLKTPLGVAIIIALLSALASKLGVTLPATMPSPTTVQESNINEGSGSMLVIRPRKRSGG